MLAGDAAVGGESKVVIKTVAIYKRSKLNKREMMSMPRRVQLTHKRLGVETLRRTKASTYLQVGTARGEYFGAAWFQNLIHNNISHESTYDYDYKDKINISGGINR